MAIAQPGMISRVGKPTKTLKGHWTEAIKDKIVQNLISDPSWTHFADRPKSQHNAALQEALECTKCDHVEIIPYMMQADIAMGLYITAQYPLYFANASAHIEEVSPFDTTSHQSEAVTFWDDITISQQKRYYEQVDNIIKKTSAHYGWPASEDTALFAHYQVDFHIRQHYLAPKSLLSLCRDKKDVLELRHWQWETAESEGLAFREDSHFGVGWIWDPTNSLNLQYEGWKMRADQRETRLIDSQVRWAEIQSERKRQRMRSVTVVFNGEPVRVYRWEASEPPLSEAEIEEIARVNAGRTNFEKPIAQSL
ncbi:uncharacterized protein N7529_011069 [Penicillium soppii]|uniref:uncharacterized protein n=1 Tax=Penicillium soppii TaxID=69789 RepID=UPI0025467447|nr:uncharacterized protein N7529_011069 [Penicillium soppii]KAJ5851684.1 hypothetical protein N7529_011069 [Penicillium soppii]